MAKKVDHEYTDAKGDLHKVFADGRTEIYHKGPHAPDQEFMEITDKLDESIKRRRFMPWTKNKPIEDTLETRDDSLPGMVDLDDDFEGLDDVGEDR